MKLFYKRGLLKKYLLAFISIILVSFFSLGLSLYFFIYDFGFKEKIALLKQNANDISSIITESGLEKKDSGYEFKSDYLIQGMIDTVSKNINSDIFIVDLKEGNLLLSSNQEIKNSGKKIPDNALDEIYNYKTYEKRTKLNGIYESEKYTFGMVFYDGENYEKSELRPIGAVFISTDASNIEFLQKNIIKLFLLASLLACIIAFIVIWIISYKLIKPLKNMVNITQNFSNGDFSQRVKVTTNDEIGELGNSFNEMADVLEKSDNTRKNFIANVSHELKTPMTTISGFVDGILDGTIPKENQKQYLLIVSEEVNRLSRLVRSMLNLSKIDSDEFKLVKTKFDLFSTVLNVFTTFEKIIKDKNVEVRGFENCKSVFINADEDMIHQVIYNLVENATKFVNSGGYIEIRVFKKYNSAFFVIKNSGEGISSEDIKHVFDRFYKTDKSRSKDKNGMGLGLYLVKKILNLHGGKIKAASVDKECMFKFFIPCDK